MQGLPLNGRNFTQLLTLTPGVVGANVDLNAGEATNNNSTGAFPMFGTRVGTVVIPAIAGQGNRGNMFSVDGLNDEGVFGSTYAVPLIIDDIQEFKVQSVNDESVFGGSTGGVINIVSKSGTNDFRGTAWEFLRNSDFDARNPFLAEVTPLHQNQWGANLGGPINLPHFNGRKRLFFFASYEQYHQAFGGELLYSVPTAAELGGDLSSVKQQIYNPFSTRPDPANPGQYIRDPFTNNQIPTSLMDQTMLKIATLFPSPVQTNVPGDNGWNKAPTVENQYEGSGRIDVQFNPSNSGWFRYTRYSLPITAGGPIAGISEPSYNYGWNLGGSYLHSFNATTLIQAQFGRTYDMADNSDAYTNKPVELYCRSGMATSFVCGFLTTGCQVPTLTIPGLFSGWRGL